ncbi:MAG TPA: pantetheine-phosphate adenylyltransferase [Bacteroidales bacterium]|jgi:pantetheine-phosphate adenylyltransferase|nr:pantetheine-phosphate adenylyltransferase [Bacteroidales bacterium]
MKKTAVFPGSFDPFTVGHESVVRRALAIFDEIIIAVGENAEKKNFFSLKTRMDIISKTFKGEQRVKVASYSGLTVDFCKSVNAGFLLRGLRTSADFEFERAIGQVNKAMAKEVETVFLLTAPEHSFINSTIVRDVLKNGGDASGFVPSAINIKDYRKAD